MAADGTALAQEPINLARTAPFRLGALAVDPATRQLVRGDDRETLEPRMMQVLVALWRAQGAVVSRDDLIASCWDGRVVGDNAIHRTISRLRDIASGIGESCFRLETVSKVGYRLIALYDVGPTDASSSRATVWWKIAIALAAVASIAAAVWFWLRPALSNSIQIVAANAASAELANGIAVDLARLASARGSGTVFLDDSDRGEHGYILKVDGRTSNGIMRADVTFVRNRSNELLWSADFPGIGRDDSILRERTAYGVSATVACALAMNDAGPQAPDARLRLLLTACDHINNDPGPAAIETLRAVAAENPGNAQVLATLAFFESEPQIVPSDPVQYSALRASAKEHLRTARALNDRLATIYAAQVRLIPAQRFQERLSTIDKGLAADPQNALLYGGRSQILSDAGLMDDALASARQAVALDPASQSLRDILISILAYDGFLQAAWSELASDERIWPNSKILSGTRHRVEYRFGNAAKLLREIDQGNASSDTPRTMEMGRDRAYFVARVQPTPYNIDAAVAQSLQFGRPPFVPLQTLVQLGRIDQAFDLMRKPRNIDWFRRGETEILFRINMRPFVLDRRFMAIASALGLVTFWQNRKTWPDFCFDKDVSYDCKTEAQRLQPKTP